jgi:hypothetical protein
MPPQAVISTVAEGAERLRRSGEMTMVGGVADRAKAKILPLITQMTQIGKRSV